MFLGQKCWYAIRIARGMQPSPISAITHCARVSQIKPYGERGQYKPVFSEKAEPTGPIRFGDAPTGSTQSPRYTRIERLRKAKILREPFFVSATRFFRDAWSSPAGRTLNHALREAADTRVEAVDLEMFTWATGVSTTHLPQPMG